MEIGTQIGPYRIDGLLGQGGMAAVYKAWHNDLHRFEAMKVLPPQMTFDASFVERFLNEARMAAGLHHNHIAAIHTISEPSCPQPYFTMELIEGGDLSDLLEERGVLPLSEALPILQQIGAALDYAHSRGLIHRDVKPGNVLLKEDGASGCVVKVVDFGIARAKEETGGKRLTKTGMIIGTPEYMSPEQGGSGAMVDHHTDQYSLAVIAYEMLCGTPPFKAESETSMLSVIMQHVRDEPRPPREYSASLSEAANAAILKALAKNPTERFDSCAAFLGALAGSIVVKPVKIAPPIHTPQKRTFPLLPVALGVLALLGVGVIGFALNRGEQTFEVMPPPVEEVAQSTPTTETEVAPMPVSISVPDVVGKTEAQAKEIIKAKSLKPDVVTGYSNAFEAQQVMSQSPAVGASAAKGAPVRIRVSLGPKDVPQPDVPMSSWTTYRDSRRGWSLEYPSGWTPSEKYYAEDNRTRVEIVGPAPFVSIVVDVSPDTSGQTPLQSWQGMDSRFRRVHGDRYNLISMSESPLGNQPGAQWIFTLRKRGEPRLKKIDRGITYNGDGYALLFVAPADEFEKWQSAFDRAYLSFKLGEN